jgi:hypothetical protein
MPRLNICAALCCGLLLASLGLSESAIAQSAQCVWYADMALKQQQRNEHGKCGFTGPGWSYDRRAHLEWCAMQTPEHWKAEAQRREKMLAGCK